MAMNKVEICGVNTAKLPLLKNEEKEALFQRIMEGDKDARELYIKGNLRLVLSVIKRFSGTNENVDDLFQIGCIGLMKAIDNFNPEMEVKFSTYAVPMNVPCRKSIGGIKMTRKQAIVRAIEILSADKKNKEICEILRSIEDDLPMNHWSDKAIFDAFDQYICDNNRLPSRSEITKNSKLPTHSTVKNRFGITLQEFYKKYYSQYIKKCPSSVYHYHSAEYWIEDFKKQYEKNNYPTQGKYDSLREKNTPCSRHIIKLSGYKNWNELIYNCGFEVRGQNVKSTVVVQEKKTNYNVTAIFNKDVNEEQIKEINQNLQSIIESEKAGDE